MEETTEIELLRRLAWENVNEEDKLDIDKMVSHFEKAIVGYPSGPDFAGKQAQYRIISSKTKIRELQLEIEKLETEIRNDEKVVRRSKRYEQTEKFNKGKGRPVRSEYNVNIAKNFVSKWVSSLMKELEVESCQKLEQLISPHCKKYELNSKTGKREEIVVPTRASERNWRRWLKGEALLNVETFENLRLAKIEFGDNKGKLVVDIRTDPRPEKLHKLLMYV
jgi:hypothetical protein